MRRGVKNLLSFLLVLVLTVCTVATLSTATAARSENAPARYSEELRASQSQQPAELSAAVAEKESSPLASAGAFLLVLAVPTLGVTLYARSRRKEHSSEQEGRSYSPRADRSFNF